MNNVHKKTEHSMVFFYTNLIVKRYEKIKKNNIYLKSAYQAVKRPVLKVLRFATSKKLLRNKFE